MVLLILTVLVIYVTMVYGPIAAWLVELFPARIRYTSMSLPYHIGNGWFGGFLPTVSFALVALTGDIYYGLWYPIVVAVVHRRGRRAVPARQARGSPVGRASARLHYSSVNHCTSTRRFSSLSGPAGSSQPRPTTSMRDASMSL